MAVAEMQAHAAENLRYIRETMERASAFTAVPGRGGMLVGLTALAAAAASSRAVTPQAWIGVWLVEAAVAFVILLVAMQRKAARTGASLSSAPGRKFILSFTPAMVAGAVLTVALAGRDATTLLPALWLCLYGVAVIGAGTYSVGIVPAMGAGFLVLGGVAAVAPPTWSDALLATGFGGLHLFCGFLICRRHGG
ncbi:MAG TPA: hypothetical protein VES20_06750 [Bryobacteraceae bacterium]|nr:hypothetical protein [Bryobacteraceae bacterium]